MNLSDYLDTGLFLDHRGTRSMLAELATGKRLLNLFAYTATATIAAASTRSPSRIETTVEPSSIAAGRFAT